MSLIKIYTYGSLRLNEYNYSSFIRAYGIENYKYIDTHKIKGYQLLDLGPYPAVIEKENSELIVDEFLVSEEVYDSIKRMEIGAGYEEVRVNGAFMYIFKDNKYNYSEVESGDWSKHLNEKSYV